MGERVDGVKGLVGGCGLVPFSSFAARDCIRIGAGVDRRSCFRHSEIRSAAGTLVGVLSFLLDDVCSEKSTTQYARLRRPISTLRIRLPSIGRCRCSNFC